MRKFINSFPFIFLLLLLITMPGLVLAEEPDLQQWFNQNSYTIDVATNKTGMGAFPAEEYRATIKAEFALYAPNNTFGWYPTATGTLHQLFAGEDSAGDTVDFSPTETFGVYIGSPEGTFYSEKSRNSDQSDHAWVFLNPKAEGGYVVAWEDMLSAGDKDYQDMAIVMQTLRPHAAFSWSPLNPQVNETVAFNASASTSDGGTIVSYEWNFGDGSPAKIATVCTHRYVVAGDFIVTLNVTDSEGKWDTESKMVSVQEPAEFAVTIEGQWTTTQDRHEFTAPAYCKTFKVEVRIANAVDMFGCEFWLEFDPTLIQLTDHEIKHLHTEDFVALEEVDNTTGTYKQAVTAKAPSQPYNGSAVVADLWFHIIKDACYPYNYTSMLRLNNTKMTDPNGTAIENLRKHGYFDLLSVQPRISIETEGKTGMVNWIADSTFTVDLNLTDIIRMKGFYIELGWCDCLETNIQNVEVTGFLPPPYELYIVNMSARTLTVQVRASTENSATNGTGFLLRVTFKAKNPWGSVPPYSLVGGKYLPENCTCKISFVRGWIDVYCPEYRKMEFYNSSYGVNVKGDFTYAFTPIPGDLNLDGMVDIVDLSAISSHMDCKVGDPEWSECCQFDLTGDGSIDLADVVIVATNVGRTHP